MQVYHGKHLRGALATPPSEALTTAATISPPNLSLNFSAIAKDSKHNLLYRCHTLMASSRKPTRTVVFLLRDGPMMFLPDRLVAAAKSELLHFDHFSEAWKSEEHSKAR